MVQRLGLTGETRRELKAVLRDLLQTGELVKVRGSQVGLPSRTNLVVGKLGVNPGGFGFVSPEREGARARNGTEAPRNRSQDVYVAAQNMKGAMHGDRVVVRIESVSRKGTEGAIVRVLERGVSRLVGRFAGTSEDGGRVIPFDKRFLVDLAIPPGDVAGAADGQMVLAEITTPPTATRNPRGRVLEILGRLDDPGVDVKVVMAKYDLPDAFPEEVEAEASRVPTEVRPEDVAPMALFLASDDARACSAQEYIVDAGWL